MAFESGKKQTNRDSVGQPGPVPGDAAERGVGRVRLVVTAFFMIGAALVAAVVWRSSSPPPPAAVEEVVATELPAPTVPRALSRTEIAVPTGAPDADPFVALRKRRVRPEWKYAAGITRGPTSILGIRCDFKAFDVDHQPLDVESHHGPAGVFLLELPPEARSVRATPVGRFHLDAATVLLPDGDVNRLQIELTEASGEVRGRVVDPDGVGIEDVRVTLAAARGRRMTDAAGQFRFRPLRDESYSVQVSAAALSKQGRLAQTVELENGLQSTALIFVIERGATVTGRTVAKHSQAPISGVTVTLASPGGRAHRSLITDRDGEFLFSRVASGEYRLTAARSDGAYGRVLLPIANLAGDELRDVTVEMSTSAGSLLGQIVDPKSGPLPFAQLVATRASDTGDVLEQLRTSSNSSGRFRFPGIATGSWSIQPEDAWCRTRNWVAEAPARVQIIDGIESEIELRVHAGAYLKGSVTSSSGKKGLQVRVSTDTGVVITRGVSARGRFLIAGLRPGLYVVEAVDPAHLTDVLHQAQVYVSADDPGNVRLLVP